MLLVAIDTSGRNGSAALCRGDQDSFEVLQLETIQGGTYSARLMPLIAEILTRQQISKEQVDAFVVVSGPGSFTGLRVGIATVKGLCEVLRKPLAEVSMLEAVALARGADRNQLGEVPVHDVTPTEVGSGDPKDGTDRHDQGRALTRSVAEPNPSGGYSAADVTVALDAGRGEVYVGEFKVENPRSTTERLNRAPGQMSLVREYIAKLSEMSTAPTPPKEGGMGHPAEWASKSTPVLTTDSKVADGLLAAGVNVQQVAALDAGEIGRIGLKKLLRGETANPATLDANYIRRSDAELFSAPKR